MGNYTDRHQLYDLYPNWSISDPRLRSFEFNRFS